MLDGDGRAPPAVVGVHVAARVARVERRPAAQHAQPGRLRLLQAAQQLLALAREHRPADHLERAGAWGGRGHGLHTACMERGADGILLGVARAEPFVETERLIAERRQRGLFGDLRFTLTNTARSCHPERLVRGAAAWWRQRCRCGGRRRRARTGRAGRLPLRLERSLRRLRERLEAVAAGLRAGGARCAVFVDSNHLVDREAAVRAGLAFYGKNTLAIVPGEGSFVALGAVVTDAELEPEPALVPQGCGSCTLCLDACPTGALVEPGVLDATACISTSTQQRGPIPAAHADALEDRVYGCDICQDVCPWNRGPARRRAALEPAGEPGSRWRTGSGAGRRAAGPLRPAVRARPRPALPAAQRARRARQRRRARGRRARRPVRRRGRRAAGAPARRVLERWGS